MVLENPQIIFVEVDHSCTKVKAVDQTFDLWRQMEKRGSGHENLPQRATGERLGVQKIE